MAVCKTCGKPVEFSAKIAQWVHTGTTIIRGEVVADWVLCRKKGKVVVAK
jgi:hypothetical protein